ncbi:tRNA modification GTPase [Tenacibaculum sp. 190524A02b]|uniref:tRNA modification GTPase n=1 Tax=Tenacibaculum vairaonense TaxID=3137860 RepID=UPI0032B1D3DB
MKNCILYLALFIYSFNSFAQNTFKKGYFINNNNQRTECLIEDLDWKNTPTKFNYQLNNIKKTATIDNVKEFSIYNVSKYIRKEVEIDKSSKNVNKLSDQRAPIFKKEILFLKVLIEGKANLFKYENNNLVRFFYSQNDYRSIKQLIYKLYQKKGLRIGKNKRYHQQLYKNLSCHNISLKDIEKLEYKMKDLFTFFNKYNLCHNSKSTSFVPKSNQTSDFNITLKAGFSNSSLNISNSFTPNENNDFGSENNFRLGLELEYVLPFNNNKWSIYTRPTYQTYKTNKQIKVNSIVGGVINYDVNYKSIEIPLGFKHYFFLNKNSKLYTQLAYVMDISLNSSIIASRLDDSVLETLKIRSRGNFSLGLGYKYQKYSVELEYQSSRNILGDYLSWNSEYKSFNITLGYTLF